MSYENLASTKMLATNCAVCGRPLRDAVSVEMGIGPDCREKHGYNEFVNDVNRAAANKLIFEIADKQTGMSVVEATRQLRNMGFTKLAMRIATRLFSIHIIAKDGVFVVRTPYTERGVSAFRTIPGRRWDKAAHASIVPLASKQALWVALQKGFPGYKAVGPEGQLIEIPALA
jgi:hypothetical protein